jgi:ABC-2 type transport system ATP-binding protein
MERVCDRVGIVRASRLVAVERIQELSSMKIRRVRFTLASGARAPERLAGFPVRRSQTDEFDVEVRGPIDPFIKELAALPLEELEISHASLEEIFLEYYRNGETPTEVSSGS